jgi:hypothetical protein
MPLYKMKDFEDDIKARREILFLTPSWERKIKFMQEFADYICKNELLAQRVLRYSEYTRRFIGGGGINAVHLIPTSNRICGQTADVIVIEHLELIDKKNLRDIESIIMGDKYRRKPKVYRYISDR